MDRARAISVILWAQTRYLWHVASKISQVASPHVRSALGAWIVESVDVGERQLEVRSSHAIERLHPSRAFGSSPRRRAALTLLWSRILNCCLPRSNAADFRSNPLSHAYFS